MNAADDIPQDQWEAAVKILLATLRVQAEAPGSISAENLPKVLHDAADERDRQGDYAAARLLDEWAQMLMHPMGDGECGRHWSE